MATNNPVINEPIYFNLFECGKNLFNKLDATCKRACMTNSKEKYYTEIYRTLTDYNDRNNTPLSNAKTQEEMRKVIEEESISDSNNVTADTFSNASNTQRKTKTQSLQVRS